jgi:hypothetical protein
VQAVKNVSSRHPKTRAWAFEKVGGVALKKLPMTAAFFQTDVQLKQVLNSGIW